MRPSRAPVLLISPRFLPFSADLFLFHTQVPCLPLTTRRCPLRDYPPPDHRTCLLPGGPSPSPPSPPMIPASHDPFRSAAGGAGSCVATLRPVTPGSGRGRIKRQPLRSSTFDPFRFASVRLVLCANSLFYSLYHEETKLPGNRAFFQAPRPCFQGVGGGDTCMIKQPRFQAPFSRFHFSQSHSGFGCFTRFSFFQYVLNSILNLLQSSQN